MSEPEPVDPATEAGRLVEILGAQPVQLLSVLSQQLSVLKTQAQVLIGLCGLTVTVTGFSGSHMVRSGRLSSSLLVLGIAFVLIAAIQCLRTLTETRWVTQDLTADLVTGVRIVFERRNRLQHRLSVAGRFVALGLAAYLGAVASVAWSAAL